MSEVSYPATGSEFCLSVEDRSFWFAHRNRAILAAIRAFPVNGLILDVGAGNGFVTGALGQPAIAIEPGFAGARNARKRGVKHVVCGTSASLKESSAAGIGLFDVIEHMTDDRAFLESLKPMLVKDGRVYITTPAYQFLWSDEDVAARHHRRYTRTSLRALLIDAGFEPEYLGYFFWWLPLVTFFTRTLQSKITQRPVVATANEHTAGSDRVRRFLEKTFAFEATMIARGLRLPFGGSVIAVARVKD